MARCPECQTEQNVDFGMATCSQCGAVFMVEIDGAVAEDLEPAQEMVEEPLEAEPVFEAVEAEPVEEQAVDVEYSEDFLDNMSEQPAESTPSSDPLGIQRFDESAASQLGEGEYLYDVIITGIDSADLKKDVLFALSEKRFALSISAAQKEIQAGELTVRDLNPVRAMLIVLRLQALDVTVEWRQRHFTKDEPTEESEAEI
jgi:hypothetical protein